MKNKMLCIIPARGGSKRIPRKNIKNFLGVPILEYPIKAALDSELFTTVMVSTDDEKIAERAKLAGASVPFLRSKKNSDDHASTADVLHEVLIWYQEQGIRFEYACCCYPTAVFTSSQKLQEAYKKLRTHNADCIFPVAAHSSPIMRAFHIVDKQIEFIWPEHEFTRSQDLPTAYYDTGQFYLFRVSSFLEERSLLCGKTIPLEVSALEAQDIDNESDWKLAELKFQLLKEL